MADENNKKIPKTTLIKQSKTEKPADPESGTDKKKVVLVKKKVVVKKPPEQIHESSPPSSSGGEKAENTKDSGGTAEKAEGRVHRGNESEAQKKDKFESRKSSGGGGRRGGSGKNKSGRYHSPSIERIESGKDSAASPPCSTGQRGVQVLDTSRTGGRAGFVAGRRVDGRNQHFQGRQRTPGEQGARGGFRDGSARRNNNFSGRSRPFGNNNNAPGTDNRPSGNRTGGPRRPGAPGFRPGGFSQPMAPPPPPQSQRGKKFYKAKKTYEKNKEQQEKLHLYSKKRLSVQTNPVPKKIDIMEVITVSALAKKMNLKASDLISKLMGMGMMVTINQQIDAETAGILADDYGCKVNIVSLYDETIIESNKHENTVLASRPPIVTVMGHVDHGKTRLLDAIRDADVISGEHGGITQHIGAYMVHTEKGNITFLDTPGHSAFTMMRARGAQITDIVVLVVAADDGVKPRTVEAIEHAKAAGSPIIVAINKMDLPEANPERVKQQLSEYNLMPEDWGGTTQFVEISALNGDGIQELLDTLTLESEMLDLKANWDCRAEGKVIESRIDQGRGIVATVLVENGKISIGDSFVAGIFHGKVRAMFDDSGNPVKQAEPAMPVEILGFSGVPHAGDPFQVTENERDARQYGSKRQELRKMETARNVNKITLDNLYDSIQIGSTQDLKVIIKGDVHGSVEALKTTLEELSTNDIKLYCVRAATGAITEDDVNLAAASNAVIIGFHVRPTPRAQAVAEREGVDIRKYNVIFEAVDDIKAAMEGMLAPEYEEYATGKAEVRNVFKVPKIGAIAGCMMLSGIIKRKSRVHVYREDKVIHTGGLASLKRFKDDVKEVKEGYECGIGLEHFTDIQVGDVLEVFDTREKAKKLGAAEGNE
ncbi:MAG: translation initiation factor IF-2 [Spirochaeta sp. LUC14_002_19_P3]|nr:MAG: translation initiation factor IF-2 [Spirochaeta sp. LUC14_002_19_P3]